MRVLFKIHALLAPRGPPNPKPEASMHLRSISGHLYNSFQLEGEMFRGTLKSRTQSLRHRCLSFARTLRQEGEGALHGESTDRFTFARKGTHTGSPARGVHELQPCQIPGRVEEGQYVEEHLQWQLAPSCLHTGPIDRESSKRVHIGRVNHQSPSKRIQGLKVALVVTPDPQGRR